jgi:hypothetical protein
MRLDIGLVHDLGLKSIFNDQIGAAKTVVDIAFFPGQLNEGVEGVEKVILGYIFLRQRRCNWNAHPSTEVISTRWRDTSRTMLTKSL